MVRKHPYFLLFILTFAVYFFSLFNTFVWDDEQFIYRNAYVANFSVKEIFTTNTIAGAGEISNYYRPLTTLSFALDYQFWGLNPFGYHLVNTLLHTFAGLLLFTLLQRLQFPRKLSWAVALIFLLHPLQTEAVTYVNSRGDSLYSFFAMLSLVLLTFLFDKQQRQLEFYGITISVSKLFVSFLVAFFFVCSVLSKEIALATLGLHGLVTLRILSQTKRTTPTQILKQNALPLGTFLLNILLVVVYLSLRATTLNFDNTFNFFDDTSMYSQSLIVRLLTFSKILFIYLRLIVFPFPLHMERTTDIITQFANPWPWLFVLAVAGLAFASYQQWKLQQKTTILFGWAWFSVMLVPVTGIIAINGLLYEHWLYLPIIGFVIAVYGLTELFAGSILKKSALKYIFWAVITIYGVLTIRQNYLWSTPVRLYTHLLKYTDSARIHNNLAMAYSEESRYEDALQHYQSALEYGVPYPQIYHNMGNTYATLGRLQDAQASYEKALQLDPAFYHSYPNLISVHINQGAYEEALAVVKMAQTHYPQQIEYDLMELQVVAASEDAERIEQTKLQLRQKYQGNSEIIRFIETLQLSQGK